MSCNAYRRASSSQALKYKRDNVGRGLNRSPSTPAQTPHPAAPSCETLIVQLTITSLLDSPIDKAHIALTVAPGDAEGPAPVGYHGETPALPEPPLGQGRQHLVIRSITGGPRRARLHPAQLK